MSDPWLQKVTIGGATLYLGDAMQIMPVLPACDLAVSDVPYVLTSGGQPDPKGHRTMAGIFSRDRYSNDGQIIPATVPFPDMMAAIYAALADDADCYVMANDKNVLPLGNAATDSGFGLHNILPWDKITPTANRWYMKHVEFTLYLWKGRARTINNPSAKQLVRGGLDKIAGHPTEKPVPLMAEYIRNSSQTGQVVLDPFMGSGTTGVAALHLGRRFVGIEIDPGFFAMACNRIAAAHSHPDMFSEAAQ